MFTNNGSTLQTDITTFGVNMKLAHLGRQALMSVMAVALVAGMSVKSFADEGLLNKVKERGTQDLRVGRIDAILVDRLAALDLVKKTNDTLAVTGEAFSRQESGVALRKGNEDLLKAVNDAIAEMQKDGTLQALSEKWFGADVTK